MRLDSLLVVAIMRRRLRQRQQLQDRIDDADFLSDIGISYEEATREISKPFWRR